MVVVVDEPVELEDLVRRLIREELQRGNLDKLIQAREAVEASFTLRVEPSIGVGGAPVSPGSFSLSVTPRLGLDVGPTHQVIRPEGIASAEVVVEPTVKAEAIVIPAEVVDAVRTAAPKLADEIQTRDPADAKRIIEMFTALVGLLTAFLLLYIAQHPAVPVTPQQIIQFYDQSQHVVNQTTIVNPPPPHGAG